MEDGILCTLLQLILVVEGNLLIWRVTGNTTFRICENIHNEKLTYSVRYKNSTF
jgi:hypothetical protein